MYFRLLMYVKVVLLLELIIPYCINVIKTSITRICLLGINSLLLLGLEDVDSME